MQFSTTQATNYVTLAALIALVLQKFHVVVTQDEVLTAIMGVIALASVVISIVNRYKQGDVTPLGFRKSAE